MFFWFFCLFIDLLVPVIAIVFGLKFRKAPPKSINSLFGYRTERSMKDHESWVLAHNLCGNIWYKLGLVMLPLSLISMLFRRYGTLYSTLPTALFAWARGF